MALENTAKFFEPSTVAFKRQPNNVLPFLFVGQLGVGCPLLIVDLASRDYRYNMSIAMWRKRTRKPDEADRVINNVEKARERTLNRAVRLLAAKPRSVGELRERLLEKNWTNQTIVNAVIANTN